MLSSASDAAGLTGQVEVIPSAKSPQAGKAGLSDIVVWLKPIAGGSAHPPAQHAELLQHHKMFHPHVLAVTVGSTVEVPNLDPIFHNAFSSFDGQIFDLGLYAPGSSRSIHFRRAGIVRVFCNIHPSMSAVIVVLDTPYFSKVDQAGNYKMTNVPAGVYELSLFDEREASNEVLSKVVTVEGDEPVVAPVLRVSESGYVKTPHRNKYGMDYPPNADETGSYTAAPR